MINANPPSIDVRSRCFISGSVLYHVPGICLIFLDFPLVCPRFTENQLVEGGGFEPPKLARQIYSLIPLATREPLPAHRRRVKIPCPLTQVPHSSGIKMLVQSFDRELFDRNWPEAVKPGRKSPLQQTKVRFCFTREFNDLRHRIRRHIHVPQETSDKSEVA